MLNPKYQLGQLLYAVTTEYQTHQEHVYCDTCNSTGKVKIENKENPFLCPTCRGMMNTINDGWKYKIFCSGMVGKIQIEEYAEEYEDYISNITYMLDVTGIGTGRIFNESSLFASKQEAEEFCANNIPIKQ